MTKKRLLFLISFVLYGSLSGQDLVQFNDLTFTSEIEQRIFDDYFNKKVTDHFDLFMANGQLLREPAMKAANERFSNYISAQAEKLQSKKNEKKVKMIYDDIHKTFLSKYELKNKFEDIFYNGHYNCVSASALYGLAFEKLKIPYTIKEKPDHIYLIAFPDNEGVMVETTSPVGGFYKADPQFKYNFVKVLKDQKLITAQEYGNKTTDELFDKFYFGKDANITLTQLIGIHYMNGGIFLMEEEKFLEAYHEFEKAFLFYPSERAGYLLMVSGLEAFRRKETKDSAHAEILGKLSRYKRYGVLSDMVKAEYAGVVENLLFDKGESEALDAYYKKLISMIRDPELRDELSFVHYYENGRYYFNKARFRECLPYFEECLKLKPKHLDSNRNFIVAMAESLRNKPNLEVMEKFEEYSAKYPVLLENNIFNQMLGSIYLMQIRISFEASKASDGEKFRAQFEKFRADHSEANFDSQLIGEAYSSAAVYYFRKGQTAKSKAVLSRGLELDPNNYQLESRRRMIQN
jgi:tetratricopeptide (TPR) repeat protein